MRKRGKHLLKADSRGLNLPASGKCQCLGKGAIACCSAQNSGSEVKAKTYIPSPFQLQEYCMNEKFEKCPFYLVFANDNLAMM